MKVGENGCRVINTSGITKVSQKCGAFLLVAACGKLKDYYGKCWHKLTLSNKASLQLNAFANISKFH